jgi:spore maturation protein CgeB
MIKKILLLTVGRVNYNCDINFYEPLTEICLHVIRFNYLERYNRVGRKAMNQQLLELVRAEQPDCVFFITYRDEIQRRTIKQITDSGVITLAWFSDDHWRFDDYSKKWAPVLSYSVTTDRQALHKYRKLGYPAILSQWAANPRYYRPYPVEKIHDVTFVGQRNALRESVCRGLLSRGVNLHAFGRGWGDFIPFEDMVRLYSQSKINLNIGAYWGGPHIKQIKGRVFEVPMAGGFLLTDYAPGLEEFFEIGKEIVCYEDLDDATRKIEYYLAHGDEREAIARAGRERSLRDHTWVRRLTDLFEQIEVQEQERTTASTTQEASWFGPLHGLWRRVRPSVGTWW